MPLIDKQFLNFGPFGTAKNKWFKGRGDMPLLQGQITFDGKAIGTWSDDAYGGVTRILIEKAEHRGALLKLLRTGDYAFVKALRPEDQPDDHFLLQEFAMQLSMQCTAESEFKRITKGNVLAYEEVPQDGTTTVPRIFALNALYTEENVKEVTARLNREQKSYYFLNTILGLPYASKEDQEAFMDNSYKSLSKKRIIVKYRKSDGEIDYAEFAATCSPDNIAKLQRRYGETLVEILNLRWR